MDRQIFGRHSLARTLVGVLAALLIGGGLAVSTTSCGDQARKANAEAQKVTNRQQLIGGLNALGEVGDYRLSNDEVRLIVQNKGYNRGFGLFGGSLIDADLVRTNSEGDIYGGNGQDTLGEVFPAFFLEAINPDQIEVVNDGSDGEAAIVEVSGHGGEFITMLRYINQVMVNSYEPTSPNDLIKDALSNELSPPTSDKDPLVEFSTRYILEPSARHVRIESTITNTSGEELTFPNQKVLDLIKQTGFIDANLENFTIPTGHVLGMGAVNSIFVPGIGYDLRWGLENAYRQDVSLPALPGHLTQFIATSNPDRDISYGFFSKTNPETNFPFQKDQQGDLYNGRASKNDMLFLFYASGFGGVLTNQMPQTLEADESFTYTNYFVIGDGDVSSITDEIYEVRDLETERVRGQVIDELSSRAVGSKVNVFFYKPRQIEGADLETRCSKEGRGVDAEKPRIFNQTYTNSGGYFELQLPPGEYCYRTLEGGRPLSNYETLEVEGPTFFRPTADSRATVRAHVTNGEGVSMPAKVTVVGTHAYREDTEKRHFLYDLEPGQAWRTTDFEPDRPDDPSTRQYIEATTYTKADGEATQRLRPGEYTVYVSRGPEYELAKRDVDLEASSTARLNIQLEKVIETPNYASADLHMHAAGSIDSGLDYDRRVVSIAAEDVEVVVSSDHNYVSDYLPYIRRNGLDEWMTSVVGVELTTFEFGHFNAFPLDYEVGQINKGSIPWQRTPPQKIFDSLRKQGSLSPEETIIQVNHPRDSILGYFGQFGVDGFDTSVELGFLQEDAGATAKATSVLTSPSGDAFVRNCTEEGVDCTPNCDGQNCDGPRFESTFSWDFDALEIFNGKRLELLRHYRIPYDSSPDDPGDRNWPPEVYEALLERACEDGDCTPCSEAEDASPQCETWKKPLKSRCCEAGYEAPVPSQSCDGDPTEGACPVERMAQTRLSERYPENAILCDGGEIAYPGGLDDWYNMLNRKRSYIENRPGVSQREEGVYQKVTATGNSDSHHDGKPNVLPPGHPRNYFYTEEDNPQEIEPKDLSKAMRNHRNVVTNGPFVRMSVQKGEQTAEVGQQMAVDSKEVKLNVVVRAAPWVGADRFRIMANGEPLKLGEWNDDVTKSKRDGGWFTLDLGDDNVFKTTLTAEVDRDTWFVLEVEGDNNLFPVYPPSEVPRLPFDEIIGQIAGSFGFGGDIEGLAPSETFAVRPFAFTNPIWVVRNPEGDDDSGFTPVGPTENQCDGNGLNAYEPGSLRKPGSPPDASESSSRLDATSAPLELPTPEKAPLGRPHGAHRDVRTLFRAWGHH